MTAAIQPEESQEKPSKLKILGGYIAECNKIIIS